MALGVDENTIAEILASYWHNGGSSNDFIVVAGNATYQWYVSLMTNTATQPDRQVLRTNDVDLKLQGTAGDDGRAAPIVQLASALGAERYSPSIDDHTPEMPSYKSLSKGTIPCQ